ncbi:hypothetical protein Tco_0390834 [Tanacetum coccineum]
MLDNSASCAIMCRFSSNELQLLLINHANTMAEQNVPTQPPTRTDEQIVPRSQWLTIGKSNLLFNAQKIQKNPIFQISVDILSNTNFFQAFTASANVPAIYLQQKALAITPVIPAQSFELPPSGNTVIDFVNELGYPEPVEIEKTLALTNPDTQFCKCCGESSLKLMLIMQSCYGKSLLKGSRHFSYTKQATKPSKEPKEEVTPLLIPMDGFPKVENYYLAAIPTSIASLNSAVHPYLEMIILSTILVIIPSIWKWLLRIQKNSQEHCKSLATATKRATPKKPPTTTPVKQSKPAPAPRKKPSKRKLPQKVRKGKPTFQLVDEDDESNKNLWPQE